MTDPTPTSVNNSWPLYNENLSATAANFEALTAAEAAAMPVELGLGTPHAAFTFVRDGLNILGAFAWGKEVRLSRKQSARLCELMNIG